MISARNSDNDVLDAVGDVADGAAAADADAGAFRAVDVMVAAAEARRVADAVAVAREPDVVVVAPTLARLLAAVLEAAVVARDADVVAVRVVVPAAAALVVEVRAVVVAVVEAGFLAAVVGAGRVRTAPAAASDDTLDLVASGIKGG